MEQPFIKIQPNQQKQQQLIQYIESKIKEFENYMDNDLNSPQALASLIEATKEIENAKKQGNVDYALIDNQAQKLKQLFSIFGLEIENPKLKISMQEIKGLILEREKARKEKDFKKADQIRSSLKEKGILIEDSPIGQYIQIE
jgi:cysteinyl-tRNA synthetase